PATLCGDCSLAAGYGHCGAMSARLEYGGKLYGLLTLSVPKAHIFDPEEKRLVTDVAADIALGLSAIESARARDSADKALQKSMLDLDKRVKELNCLFELSNLEQRPGLTLEEILPGAIQLIPPAFQTPGATCARITLDGVTRQTDNFRETAWKLEKDVLVDGRPEGRITVCALGTGEGRDSPPFLEEEKNLIHVIAERLGKIVERYRFQTALSVSETRFRELFNNLRNGAMVLEAAPGDEDFIIRDLNRAGEIIDGVRREEVVGSRLLETFRGIKEFGLYDALWRVYENGRSEQLPDGRFRGGGEECWREYYVYRLPTGEMAALFSDVTGQRRRKEALLASEKRFRALCENSLTGISILQG
ncbi:MAG: hypothetical protein GY859_09490, partial [Desulfobacterales bacterium]|nr:hypothetical protein [Desulfobacterales bacterium]